MWLELVEHSRNVHKPKINNQRGDFYKVNKEVSSARFEEHIFIYRALAGKCNTSFFLQMYTLTCFRGGRPTYMYLNHQLTIFTVLGTSTAEYYRAVDQMGGIY